MFKKFFLIVVFILFTSLSYADIELEDHFTYFITSNEQLTLQWNTESGAEGYQVRLFHVERDVVSVLTNDITTGNQLVFSVPRTGHYIVEIRSCAGGYTDTTCSPWIRTTNSQRAIVNNQPRSWWVYGHVQPPGPPIID